MTDKYHPVTKEELDMIKRWCFHPDWETCEGCEHESIRGIRCTHKVWQLADEILSVQIHSHYRKRMKLLKV